MNEQAKTEVKKEIAHTERIHHPFSPSSLQAREACPCFDPEQSDNQNRMRACVRGTLQHEGVELWLDGSDDQKLNDIEAAAVKDCVRYARQVRDSYGPGAKLVTEIYVPIDDRKIRGMGSDKIEREFVGTTAGFLDLAIVSADGRRAEIIDWKFGKWEVAPAEDNRQFQAYLLGLFKLYPNLESVTVHIVMPHRDELDTHTFDKGEFPRLTIEIKVVVERCLSVRKLTPQGVVIDWSRANPTVSGCLFCRHIGVCEKVADFALKLGHKYAPLQIPADITPTLINDPKMAGQGIQIAAVIKSWAEAYRKQATDRTIEHEEFMPDGYILTKTVKRVIVDKEKLLEIAARFMDEKQVRAALDVNLGPLDDAISTLAPRGSKTEAVETFSDMLRQEGAVADGDPIYSLRLANKPKQPKEKGKTDGKGIVQSSSKPAHGWDL